MYSERLLRHFREARLAGELPDPAVRVTVENPVCGDVMKLSVRVAGERIEEARFQVKGCTASIACGSALAELLTGMDLHELKRKASGIASMVEAEAGGLPEASKHAARLAADGVNALLSRLES